MSQNHSQGGDGTRIMLLETNAASRAAGTLATARASVVPDGRYGRRGKTKNDSARPPGSHGPQGIGWWWHGRRADQGLRIPNAVSETQSTTRPHMSLGADRLPAGDSRPRRAVELDHTRLR
jgi:hypothetical protein